MDCRLSSVDFDIAASAGWYSAIAGLLAGFALLYILFPLDHESADSDETETGNAVVVFTCAFFSLLILAFTVWAAIVLPLLPDSAVTSALFEHLALAVTATATVGVAGASWLGR